MRALMLGCCDRKASSFWTVDTSVERIPPANVTMSGSITAVRVRHQEFRSPSGDDSEQNLITLCSACHATLHHR